MKRNIRLWFLIFCFCCIARTVYGQHDSAALNRARQSLPSAVDTVSSSEDLQHLQEVVIRKRFAVSMDKDTTTFTADSVVSRQFDNLAQLMSRIPGIQVTKDGSIFYQGIPLRQVGIDGRPLTNFDPGRLLQLLRGRDVDQLKIYNLETTANNPGRLRDQQEKGLDIRLKEEARRGYYGKLAAGVGKGARTQWDQSADLSSFNGERKISAYILSGNTAGQSAFTTTDLPETSSLPRGTAGSRAAGIFYDKKINSSLSVNGNYGLNQQTHGVAQQMKEHSFLPSGSLNTATQNHSAVKTLSNSATIQAAYVLDSFTYISLMANAGLSNSNGSDQVSSATNNGYGMLLTSSRLTNAYESKSTNAALALVYTKQFRNAGSLSCSFAPNWNNDKADMQQYSYLDLAASGQVQVGTQQKHNTQSNSSYTINTDYKHPLSRLLTLGLNWQNTWTQSESSLQTYDRYQDVGKQMLDSLNPLYSNQYLMRKVWGALGAFAYVTAKKYSIRLGADFQNTSWKQQDIGLQTKQAQSFTNLLPSVHIRSALSKQSVVNVSYHLQCTQPVLSQIQPVLNNADPMNIITGNPGLTLSFAHNTSSGYTFIAAGGRRSFHAAANLSLIRKAITLRQSVDENGRRTSRYYNQDGNYNSGINLNYDQALTGNIRLSAEPTATYSRTVNFINNKENRTGIQTYNSRFSLAYSQDTSLNIRLSAYASYALTRNSLNTAAPGRMLHYNAALNVSYTLPIGGIILGTSCSWNRIEGSIGPKTGFMIWNAGLQRNINKEGSLSLKLYIYDLLNRNKGYMVYNELNVQREEYFSSVERFFLLGLIWHFTKR